MGEKSRNNYTLDISNDLRLSTVNFPKFSKNGEISEELNEYLRSQLEQMKNENETLNQKLGEKDSLLEQFQTKIKQMTGKLEEYEGCFNNNEMMSASQLANSKIIELSKKLRERNSEVEVYKTKCSKLTNALSDLQKETENMQKNNKELPPPANEPDEMKKLQDKLATITNKWMEEKNQNVQLKNDLKKANKWLQQEVGDKFETLLILNNSNSNWRGRAQIICDLQQKNLELKEKLKAYEEKRSTPSAESISSKHDKKVEMLSKENLEIRNSCEELKRKNETSKARCKALESECVLLKSKVSILNEKFEDGQEKIARLTSQLSCYNQQKHEEMKQKDEIIKQQQQENESLKMELIKEKCLSENKSKELLEKNDDIQLLNKRIRSSRPPSAYVHKHENPEAKIINRLEVERLRLLELTELHNNRLQDERNAHLKTQHLLRLEKQKIAKLEANLARLQLEQNSSRSGYSNKNSTPKINESDIKDKLEIAEENIKALTTRLETEILERKNDIQEFAKFLKDHDYK